MQTSILSKDDKLVKVGVVYMAKSRTTGEAYVGLTMDFKKRKSEHLYCARNGSNSLFHTALRECGETNFDWQILHRAPVCDLEELERREIAERKLNVRIYPNSGGLNCSAGGQMGRKSESLESDSTKIIANFTKRIKSTEGEEQYWWMMLHNAFCARAVPPGWSKTYWLKYGVIKANGLVYKQPPFFELQNPLFHSSEQLN